jgi:hypothetical protein
MSGGHFDHSEFHLQQIAEELERLIETNGSTEKDDQGNFVYHSYPPEIIAHFRCAAALMRIAYDYAHCIDYLLSGDYGEESFLRAINKCVAEKQTKTLSKLSRIYPDAYSVDP